MRNTPISEQLHGAWMDWADKKAAADLLDGMKSAFINQKIKEMGDIPYNRAERDVRASDQYADYIRKLVAATKSANRARGQLEYLKAKMTEWQSAEANHRMQSKN